MCVFSFDDGMVAESWYAWLAFRSRVSMSAIGSVIVMGVCCLSRRGSARCRARASRRSVVPGKRAERAARLHGWQPGRSPAGLAHAGELPGVRHLPQADPAQAELAEDRVRTPAALAAGVTADRELRRAGRLVDKSLLGHLWSPEPSTQTALSGSRSRRSGRRRGTRAA